MSARFRQSLLAQYRATHSGEPWYGSSRAHLLRGITAAHAAATPIADGRSIWAVVLHMIAWTEEVHRRLEGGQPGTPRRGDWPVIQQVDDAAWRAARAALTRAHNRLADAIDSLPSRRFAQRVGTLSQNSTTGGITVGEMLIGIVQHDAYHLGQIATVRRALNGAS